MCIKKFLDKLNAFWKKLNTKDLPDNNEFINLLKNNKITEYNELRKKYPNYIPDLKEFFKENISNISLENADFRNIDFRNVDLSNSNNIDKADMGGTILEGAQLPKNSKLEKNLIENLSRVKELSRNTSNVFFFLMAACTYCWLTITSIKDSAFILANANTTQIPIFMANVTAYGLFMFAPLFLITLYLYFNLYIINLVEEISKYPVIFSSGETLKEKITPWIINDYICEEFYNFTNNATIINLIKKQFISFFCWWFVPITILYFWFRYLTMYKFEALLSLFLTLSVTLVFFFRLKFYINFKTKIYNKELTKRIFFINYTGLVILIIFILLISIAINNTLEEEPFVITDDIRYNFYPFCNKNKLFYKFSSTLQSMRHINFEYEELSVKPKYYDLTYYLTDTEKWEEESLKFVKPARGLYGKNFNFAKANNVFLVLANLNETKFRNADLSNADLSGVGSSNADFTEADLYRANLTGAVLSPVKLCKAYLSEANLSNAFLFHTDLTDASLYRADLSGAFLSNTTLMRADLSQANLQNADLSSADLTEVKFDEWTKLDGALIDKETYDRFKQQFNKYNYKYKPLIKCSKQELEIIEKNADKYNKHFVGSGEGLFKSIMNDKDSNGILVK